MKLTDEQRLEFRKAVAEGYYDHTAVDRVVAVAEKLITETVIECRTELLHPEFGSEWQEPNGVIWKAMQDARAEGWDEAYGTGVADAFTSMEYDGGQTSPARVNPYRIAEQGDSL